MIEQLIQQLAERLQDVFEWQRRFVDTLKRRYMDRWWMAIGVLGSVFVMLNTLYLSFSRHVNSDTIAQQLIVRQWMSGVDPSFATLGETNYIIKFPLYAVIESLPFDPFARLVVTAVVLAVASWALIVFVMSRFAALLKFTDTQKYILGWLLLFLSIISHHIVWLHYPNSRTIEIGLMLGILYWLLKLHTRPASSAGVGLFSFIVGVLFINDKYALYVTGILSGLYFGYKLIRALAEKNKEEVAASLRPLIGLAGAAIVFVGGILLVKSGVTPINIQQIIDGRLATASEAFDMIPATITGLLELHGVNVFGGQLFHPAMLLSLIYGSTFGFIVYLCFSKKPGRLSAAGGLLPVVAAGVIVLFIVGNRATDASGGRYLIIVPFLLVFIAAMALTRRTDAINPLIVTSVMLAAVVTLPLSVVGVARQVSERQWQATNRATYDIIESAQAYGATKGYDTFFVSQTTTYLSDGEVLSIPVRCEQGMTHPVQLLLEAGSIKLPAEKSYVRISSTPEGATCSEDEMRGQFGAPSDITTLPDGSKLLFYDRDITPDLKPAVM